MASNQQNLNQNVEQSSLDKQSSKCDEDFFGPSLPPHYFKKSKEEKIYGPTLPVNFRKDEEVESRADSASTPDREANILIGPELPGHLKSTTTNPTATEKELTLTVIGGDDDDDDDDDDFGPSTTLMASGDVACYYKYMNAQNQNMKTASQSSIERETWMTELPERKGASFGLLPRHFKSRIQTDKESDSSVWTDTPADKKRKERDNKKEHKDILKKKRLQERDKEMEKLVKKAAKKLRKKESLLEIHQKNMKTKQREKRQREGETLPERRPFDRNVDLQIPKFDENQKRAILSKSQFLNDRFAPGESKFL